MRSFDGTQAVGNRRQVAAVDRWNHDTQAVGDACGAMAEAFSTDGDDVSVGSMIDLGLLVPQLVLRHGGSGRATFGESGVRIFFTLCD